MRFETFLLLVALILCVITTGFSIGLSQDSRKKHLVSIFFCFIPLLLLVDVSLLLFYQIQNDYRFLYVYNHTSNSLKTIYRISALWSGQEGSFLLWSLIMTFMGLFVLRIKTEYANRIIATYCILCGVILILTIKSNPFQLTQMSVTDGLGLNEALQNPWMVVHPPLVFIGYSAMGVLFSIVFGLKKNIKDQNSLSHILQFWNRISFLFLGIGIFTGSIWAYTALGWGGYWAWDPIENAALVPWLILCAYLHKKQSLTRLECIIPFLLACFGTFLTRSGILANKSAHAYAGGNDSVITFIVFGIFILLLSLIFILNCFNIRRKQITTQMKPRMIMKYLVSFPWITYLYAAFIFIGTIFPLLSGITIAISYYKIVSIVYISILSLILIFRQKDGFMKRFLAIMVLNTLTIVLIIFTINTISLWLILLWIVLLPIWILIFDIRRKNLFYSISHVILLLMIAGAFTSSILSSKQTLIVDMKESRFQIENKTISYETLQNKGSLVLSTFTQDYIINSSDTLKMNEATLLISYTTKPFIVFFWAGGLLFTLFCAIDCIRYYQIFLRL